MVTDKYSSNFEYEWINNIEIQLLWFIRNEYDYIDLYLQVTMSMSTTFTSNS